MDALPTTSLEPTLPLEGKCSFYNNNYPNRVFDKTDYDFKAMFNDTSVDETSVVSDVELLPVFVPRVEKASICFVKVLSRLSLEQLDLKLIPLYPIYRSTIRWLLVLWYL